MSKQYFNGSHCNMKWMELESEEAKHTREVVGWAKFRRIVLEDRGNKCEFCGQVGNRKPNGVVGDALHLHHEKKLSSYRHLRFERSNIVVCCQKCHLEQEAALDRMLSKIRLSNWRNGRMAQVCET